MVSQGEPSQPPNVDKNEEPLGISGPDAPSKPHSAVNSAENETGSSDKPIITPPSDQPHDSVDQPTGKPLPSSTPPARPLTSPPERAGSSAVRKRSPSWPDHSTLPPLPQDPIGPPSSQSSPRTRSRRRQQEDEEPYEKLGSAALLEGSVPDFGTGHMPWGRDINTKAVSHFFHAQRARRVMATTGGHGRFM